MRQTFCNNYYGNLEKAEWQGNATKIHEDIKKYKKLKKQIEKSNDKTYLELIDWFLERLREKRQEIVDGYKAPKQKSGGRDIVINDASYDIRDIKPYSYYVGKMEKDLNDNKKAILKSQRTLQRIKSYQTENEKKEDEEEKLKEGEEWNVKDPKEEAKNKENEDGEKWNVKSQEDQDEPVKVEDVKVEQQDDGDENVQDEDDVGKSGESGQGVAKPEENTKVRLSHK